MPGQGRLGDKASIQLDAHGCPACPHPGTGPAIAGSPGVYVNKRPALRVGDPGIHAACCGPNIWQAKIGSQTVFIDGQSAHRQGDQTKHCGGLGKLIEGSPNVMVGEQSASPAGGAASSTGGGSSSAETASSASASTSTESTASSTSSSTSSATAASSSATAASNSTTAASNPEPAESLEPAEPDSEFDPATIHTRAQAQALRNAAEDHAPFCEECERARARMQS